MSVGKMIKVTITGSIEKLDEASVACFASNCFTSEDPSKYLSSGLDNYIDSNRENRYLKQLEIIKKYMAMSGIAPTAVKSDYGSFNYEETAEFINGIEKLNNEAQNEKNDLLKTISGYDSAIEQLEHFSGIEVKLDEIFNCGFTKIRFGKLPAANISALDAYKDKAYINFMPFSEDENYYWGIYTAPAKDADAADRVFAALFFENVQLPETGAVPSEAVKEFNERKKKAEKQLDEIDELFKENLKSSRQKLLLLFSQLTKFSSSFEISKKAVLNANRFMLIGKIPLSEKEKFEKSFSGINGVELAFFNKGSL